MAPIKHTTYTKVNCMNQTSHQITTQIETLFCYTSQFWYVNNDFLFNEMYAQEHTVLLLESVLITGINIPRKAVNKKKLRWHLFIHKGNITPPVLIYRLCFFCILAKHVRHGCKDYQCCANFFFKAANWWLLCEAYFIWARTDSLSVAPAVVALVRCNDSTRTIGALLKLIYEIGVMLLLKSKSCYYPKMISQGSYLILNLTCFKTIFKSCHSSKCFNHYLGCCI